MLLTERAAHGARPVRRHRAVRAKGHSFVYLAANRPVGAALVATACLGGALRIHARRRAARSVVAEWVWPLAHVPTRAAVEDVVVDVGARVVAAALTAEADHRARPAARAT